ncbi:MAG TPA: hypothetical protein VK631_21045 [Solirubrobacteraceae bacterium]|nr:hypothetical protein [Solirubrobacteraceae bacterium]
MDHPPFPVVVGALTTVLGTAYGLLPERLDVTHVFAAYGAGAIAGEALAARRVQQDSAVIARRWGGAAMVIVGGCWVIGLLLRIA